MRLLILPCALLCALALSPGAGQEEGVILVGAGDIASCDNDNDSATGDLIEQIEGTVFIPGDIAYPDGTDEQFEECYDPAWGSFKERTRPAPGNHEYHTDGASGYYDYFGSAAGDPAEGWYSYDLSDWHVVALNSNCDEIGGCEAGSPQERWLRADLAASASMCTFAYWHHPRFSSGDHGNDRRTQALWQALYEHGADVVAVGHDHNYERFAPMDPAGQLDESQGIRQFVVGTGGRSLRDFGTVRDNSDVRNSDTYGVIKFLLEENGYTWVFVPVGEDKFVDSGRASCHDAPATIPTPLPAVDDEGSASVSGTTVAWLIGAGVVVALVFAALGAWYVRGRAAHNASS